METNNPSSITIKGTTVTVPDDGVCCGMLEAMIDAGFVFPFQKVLTVDFPTGETQARWAIIYHKETPGGSVSNAKNGRVPAVLNYCPFCGTKIKEDAEGES